ncbi:MAG: CPBP family intramembrane metalloprotease [Clostridia bacterium]|nr:CPBP family intramembrane metalloprotease [Clostridia bacterium]
MEENKKPKKPKHKLADRHPFVASALFSVIALFAVQLLPAAAGMITGGTDQVGFVAVAFSLIALLIYKRRFRPDFEGSLRGGRIALGFKTLIPFAVVWVINIIGVFAGQGEGFISSVSGVSIALMAGFSEEAAFRGIGISILLRDIRDEKRILHALLFTSAVFAVVHAVNAAVGADPGMTALQVAAAFCMALLLGASYIRSGNLWPVIIVHTLNDIIAFMGNAELSSSGIYTEGVTWSSFLGLALSAVMGIVGLWLIRPAKRAEIRALWEKKWGAAPCETPKEAA